MKKNLLKELMRAIKDKETGLYIFQGNNGGFVRVFIRRGKVHAIDGSYGEGPNQLRYLLKWGAGMVLKKPLPHDVDTSREIDVKTVLEDMLSSYESVKQVLENSSLEVLTVEKELWYSLEDLVQYLRKSEKCKFTVVESEDYLAFCREGKVELVLSREGILPLGKAIELSKENFYDWKVYVLDEKTYNELLGRVV